MRKWTLLIGILLILSSCETQEKTKHGFVQKPGITSEPDNSPQGCTKEAKVCPDGSSVGRIAPSCAFAPCPSETTQSYSVQTTILNTPDDMVLTGTLYPTAGAKAVLLLPMLGKTRQSWGPFAKTLHEAGYNVFAIDLRGHGESTLKNNQHIPYTAFGAPQYLDMIQDVETAVHYLQNKTVYIVGASIGANLALKYAAQNPDIQKVVLLSPGLEYRGVNVEQDNLMYTGNMLIVASKDDAYSADSVQKLVQNRKDANIKIYEAAGHGTGMLANQPELAGFLIDWMNQP